MDPYTRAAWLFVIVAAVVAVLFVAVSLPMLGGL